MRTWWPSRDADDLDGAMRHYPPTWESRRVSLPSIRAMPTGSTTSRSATTVSGPYSKNARRRGALRHYQEGLEIIEAVAGSHPATLTGRMTCALCAPTSSVVRDDPRAERLAIFRSSPRLRGAAAVAAPAPVVRTCGAAQRSHTHPAPPPCACGIGWPAARTDAERPHHLVVLVFDDVAVPDELAGVGELARTRVTCPG